MVDANVLGVVMNRLPASGPDAYGYGYYRQDEDAPKADSARALKRSVGRDKVARVLPPQKKLLDFDPVEMRRDGRRKERLPVQDAGL